MNQPIEPIVLAEKLSALMTEERLDKRADRGSTEKFERAMSKAPDVEPPPEDRL